MKLNPAISLLFFLLARMPLSRYLMSKHDQYRKHKATHNLLIHICFPRVHVYIQAATVISHSKLPNQYTMYCQKLYHMLAQLYILLAKLHISIYIYMCSRKHYPTELFLFQSDPASLLFFFPSARMPLSRYNMTKNDQCRRNITYKPTHNFLIHVRSSCICLYMHTPLLHQFQVYQINVLLQKVVPYACIVVLSFGKTAYVYMCTQGKINLWSFFFQSAESRVDKVLRSLCEYGIQSKSSL